ncbi:MAG: hypothetical protein JKX91_06710 [Rhizobiaceae bacterium]|nr:hypothetical protein [Rhizobiaceae bacterium]
MASGTGILDLAEAISKIRQGLFERGLTVRESSNFKKFKKTIAGIAGKELSEQFHPNRFELFEENAFWIGVYDQKGACVSVQAIRLDTLGSRTLVQHWQDQQKRIYSKPNKMGKNHAPTARIMTGKICYSGDFFVSPDHRGGDSGAIVFLGFLVAIAYFDPDWVYGLMHEKLANTGFPNRCGYTIQEPMGTHWLREPDGINGSDWLVATDRQNIHRRAVLIVKQGL